MLKISILLICSLFFVSTVYATSGACSYHGGVNCDAGSDWDGSVVCKDGWKDSSVKYSDATECQVEKKYYCTSDEYNNLKIKYGIDSLIYKLNENNKLLDSKYKDYEDYKAAHYSSIVGGSYSRTINSMSVELGGISGVSIALQKSINDTMDSIDKECQILGEYNYFKNLSLLIKACPANAKELNGICMCGYGYVMRNNLCVTNTEDCQLTYGLNITGTPNSEGSSNCLCDSGYIFDGTNNKCIQNISIIQAPEEKKDNDVIDPSNLEILLPLLGVPRQGVEELKYKQLLDSDIAEYKITLSSEERNSINNFIVYGISAKTLSLGAGERRALIRDYFDTIGKSDIYWQDLENLANGQKVISRNLSKENAIVDEVLNKFKKIFGHAPNFSNTKEDLFWNTMMYRIRFQRDLNKEKIGADDFKRIFNYNPKSPLDWATVRALGYILN